MNLIQQYQQKNKVSLCELAIDIGLSESSLYNYRENYKKISEKTKQKIETYLKEKLKLDK